MKSKTSFFNLTVLKKDITRFSPLWGVYTVLMLLFLLIIGENATGLMLLESAPYIMMPMAVLNLIYGGLAAFLLFGDLYKSRMCNMLHAMPLRREGWFFTHLTAGMLFCIVPNTLGALIAAGMLGEYAYAAFLWLAVMVLEYLFFFGVATFSSLCAGNGLGAVMIYTILNSLSGLLTFLLQAFYAPRLYGIELNTSLTRLFSPVSVLVESEFLTVEIDYVQKTLEKQTIPGEPWLYLGIVTLIGVVLLGLSLLIYRKRDMESAGSLISFKPAEPVFLVIYALVFSAFFLMITELTTGTLGFIFMMVGLALGFFTGRMLLEKKVNVFRPKNLLAFGILLGVLAASVGLTELDPLGVTRYVPETQQVESVSISPYSDVYYGPMYSRTFTTSDPEQIQKITELHRDALKNRPDPYDYDVVQLNLSYELKNGSSVVRHYYIYDQQDTVKTLRWFYSQPSCALGYSEPDRLLEKVSSMYIYSYDTWAFPSVFLRDGSSQADYSQEENQIRLETDGKLADMPQAQGLMEAILADCREGNAAQHYNATTAVGNLDISYLDETGWNYISFNIYESCTHTLNYLHTLAKQE